MPLNKETKLPKQIETQNIENQITTESSIRASILTSEDRKNEELFQKIMSEQKSSLPPPKNQDWKKSN